jgi:parvulin-like peptidyl-prolyl isomerase
MDNVLKFGDQILTATEVVAKLAEFQILPALCKELIIEKAIASTDLSESEKNREIEQFYTKHKLATPEAIEAIKKHYCMTQLQLEALAVKEYRLEKFKKATWGGKLEQYFMQHKPQLDKVIYSLLRTEDMEIAQELFFRIQSGEASFADCASQYSQGAEAQTGGLIGPVAITQSHPVIAQKLAKVAPGYLLPPMKLENWVVILRLEKLIPAQFDEAMKTTLLNHLFEQWLNEQLQQTPMSLIANHLSSVSDIPKPAIAIA